MNKASVIFIALVVMVLLLPILANLLKNKGRVLLRIKIALLILYGSAYLYLTLLSREPYLSDHLQLTPLWSYQKAWAGNIYMGEEIILNIFLFVPCGYFLKFVGLNWWKSLYVCVGVSFFTELIQYVTGLGFCEVDDLISNSLGALFGIWLYSVSFKLLKR